MSTHARAAAEPVTAGPDERTSAASWTARPGVRAAAGAAAAIVLSLLALALMHAANPRLLPAWHGLLHSAVAMRFPASGMPPENPFFAGAVLPYYWFYHFVGHLVQRAFGTDPMHAFQAIAFASLALLIGAAAAIGYRRFGSLAAGFAIALLALIGGNPAGLALAMIQRVRGQVLLDPAAGTGVDHLFVDNVLADRLMAQPLLAAMTFTGDWRNGHNLPWMFDISSRTPALALVIVLLYLWLGRGRAPALLGIAVVTALTTALNPLIGLAVTGALCAAQLPFTLSALRRDGAGAGLISLGKPAAALAGVLSALPAFRHMLLLEGTAQVSDVRLLVLKTVLAATVFVLLIPAAAIGMRRAPEQLRPTLGPVALAGALVVMAMIVFNLAEGNEHNLSNLAQCVLAVPAAAMVAYSRGWRRGWSLLAALALVCAPTAAATLVAFSGRPAAPLAFEDGRLVRTDSEVLQHSYDWIVRESPADGVFVIDPRRPIKLGSNVSELPAFTGRALLVDQPSYLITPHPDADYRTALAVTLMEGRPLTARDSAYLRALGRRIFLFAWEAAPDADQRLTRLWGAPQFRAPPVAIYEVDVHSRTARAFAE